MKIPERAVRIGGMAFDRLYANIIFFSTLPFAGAADTAKAQFDGLTTSLFFVMVAFALAYFFSCRNTSRLMESRAVLAASCVMVLLGSIGMMPGMLDRVPSLFSGGLAGFGSTVLFISWLGVFTRKTVTGSIIELGLAFGFAFAAAFCLSLLGSDVFVLAMALCPILSFAALMFLGRETAGNVVTCRHSSKTGRRLEYRNLIYVFFFGCIMGIMRNYSASHIFGEQSRILDSALFLSGLVVCLAAVVVARLADVSSARFLYRISFVFIMMSSILLAFGRENIAIATPPLLLSVCNVLRAALSRGRCLRRGRLVVHHGVNASLLLAFFMRGNLLELQARLSWLARRLLWRAALFLRGAFWSGTCFSLPRPTFCLFPKNSSRLFRKKVSIARRLEAEMTFPLRMSTLRGAPPQVLGPGRARSLRWRKTIRDETFLLSRRLMKSANA